MVAIKYLGVALLVLIGASAFTQATAVGAVAAVKFSLLINLCDGVLGTVGITLSSLLGLVGGILGGVVSIIVGLVGSLLGVLGGGSYNGAQFFGFKQAPTDVGTFLGDQPTSNGAFFELMVKIFFTTAPFFNKGCGHDVGSIIAQGVYVSSAILVSTNENYYNGCTFLKNVKTSDYDKMDVNELIAKWNAAIKAKGGVTAMSGPDRHVVVFGNYMFDALANKELYSTDLLQAFLRALFGLIGFVAYLILGTVGGVLQLLGNILGGISIGAGVQGYIGGWSDDVSSSCNQYLGGVTKETYISGSY